MIGVGRSCAVAASGLNRAGCRDDTIVMQPATLPSNDQALSAVRQLVMDVARRLGKVDPKRASTRFPYNAEVAIGTVYENGQFALIRPAWGFDLSARGIGMLTDRKFDQGQELYLKLNTLDGEEHVVPIRITHSRCLFGTIYRIGASFVTDQA